MKSSIVPRPISATHDQSVVWRRQKQPVGDGIPEASRDGLGKAWNCQRLHHAKSTAVAMKIERSTISRVAKKRRVDTVERNFSSAVRSM